MTMTRSRRQSRATQPLTRRQSQTASQCPPCYASASQRLLHPTRRMSDESVIYGVSHGCKILNILFNCFSFLQHENSYSLTLMSISILPGISLSL